MKKLTQITYRAYQQEPFAPDAIGYVDGRYLRDADDERFVYWDKDGQTVARSGYIFVYGDDFYAVIKKRHIYTEVVEEKALEGGYGMPHPTGGYTSADGYDMDVAVEDEDGEKVIHVRRHCF